MSFLDTGSLSPLSPADSDAASLSSRHSFMHFTDPPTPSVRSIRSSDTDFSFAPPTPTAFARAASPESVAGQIPTFSAMPQRSRGNSPGRLPPASPAPTAPPPLPPKLPAKLPLPPTTNSLDPGTRQDLVKRHRKLVQVFGETPAAVHPFRAAGLDQTNLAPLHKTSVWSEREQTLYISANRRHSSPLSPTHGFGLHRSASASSASVSSTSTSVRRVRPSSPASFVDLGEDTPRPRTRPRPYSIDLGSPPQSPLLPPDEEDRKRKRARLAKLHRFLGSRVPADLVLGGAPPDDGLPPLAPPTPEEGVFRGFLRKKRRSVPGPPTPPPADEPGLNKGELDDRERMINVKRAQKMEKMFGSPVPQTLFHTRVPRSPPSSGHARAQSYAPGTRVRRPGTPESSRRLLRDSVDSVSPEFMSYKQSLASLGALIDRKDRESLLELYDFVNDGPPASDEDVPPPTPLTAGGMRRRASLTSLAELSPRDPSAFGARRRRAAKLANFFGVGYRDLFGEVLESIESGVRDEEVRGSMQPAEVQELMHKLRMLRTRKIEMDV